MQNAVRGRAVLMLPTWYPGPSDPVAGVFVRDQALAVAAHHDVTVLVLEAAGPPPGRRTDAPRGRAADCACPRAHGPLRKLWLSLALARALRAPFRADLIHGHVFRSGAWRRARPARGAGRRQRAPLAVPALPGPRVDLLLARIAFRGAEIVAPVSESLRQAIEAYGIEAASCRNPVDTQLFHPGPASPPEPRLLSSAGLRR